MFYISSTRFNNITWEENMNYRKKIGVNGALYGTSIKMCAKYLNTLHFVIEMNNDINQICGIGLIRNSLFKEKRYNIYNDENYNRFIYKGDYWISRDYIIKNNGRLIEILENMLFKGKSHVKRQPGISVITPKLFIRWNYNETQIKDSIKNLFLHLFSIKTPI